MRKHTKALATIMAAVMYRTNGIIMMKPAIQYVTSG